MPLFFDSYARMVLDLENQPEGSIKIVPQPWETDSLNNGFPLALPPLRRGVNGFRLPGDGIVHVSTITGERHIHGELEEVENEVGMKRVISETPIPQRPLDQQTYKAFKRNLHGIFQQKIAKAIEEATDLNSDVSLYSAKFL